MIKVKGFLLLESLIAIIIAFSGVLLFSLIVCEGQKKAKINEQKTDLAIAKDMMQKNNLKKVMVHNHLYYLNETNEND